MAKQKFSNCKKGNKRGIPISAPGMSHQIMITNGPIAFSIQQARTIVVTLVVKAKEVLFMVVEEAVAIVEEKDTRTMTEEHRTPMEVIKITIIKIRMATIRIINPIQMIIQQAAQTSSMHMVAVNISSWTMSGEHRIVCSLVHEFK